MTIPFRSVYQNESYSGAPFLASTWFALERNNQHYAGDRGRMVVGVTDLRYPLTNYGTVSIILPFYATPHENMYRIQAEYAMTGNPRVGDSSILLRAWSRSSPNGGDVSLDQASMETQVFNRVFPAQNQWRTNYQTLDGLPRVTSGWLTHRCDPALSSFREIELNFSSDSLVTPGLIMAIYVVGYTDGVGVFP